MAHLGCPICYGLARRSGCLADYPDPPCSPQEVHRHGKRVFRASLLHWMISLSLTASSRLLTSFARRQVFRETIEAVSLRSSSIALRPPADTLSYRLSSSRSSSVSWKA